MTLAIDYAQANTFASALKKTPDQIRLRGFYHRNNPKKADDRGKKTAPCRKTIAEWQEDGRGVYIVINNGGDKDQDINQCTAFFIEWDDQPKEWQLRAWQELSLPEPTIVIDTGGKSIHAYWVLQEPISPDEWRPVQKILLEYGQGDKTIHNPSRVMRLPGCWYMDGEGNPVAMTQIVSASSNQYTLEQFRTYLPSQEEIEHQHKAIQYRETINHTLDEIKEAIQFIPAAVPKTKQYPFFRNLLWGLIEACKEVGAGVDEALAIIGQHSPLFREAPQVAQSKYSNITAGTFWYHAKQAGYKPPKRIAPAPAPAPRPERPAPDSRGRALPMGLSFRPLGFDRDRMFYLHHDGGQIIEITAHSHTKNKLMLLMDIAKWRMHYQKESGAIDWDSAANDCMRDCIREGVFDPERIRGRGAWFDAERVIFHLGNRLMVDNESVDVLKFQDSDFFYENARRLQGPADEPLTEAEAIACYSIAERFSWDVPASAHLLLGWIALAPVCGALDWRPHIWLTGGAGTGKTTVLSRFIRPLLGGCYRSATGGTTEAGLRGILGSDAIPVVFDEFEQNKKNDKTVVQNVLSLARIASSEGGKIYKGVIGGGGSNEYTIRSMFCVSSINVALIEKADIDRFCVLGLKKENGREERQWRDFEAEIRMVCTEEIGRKLLKRTLSRIPVIRFNATVFAAALARIHGQRFGDQHGTLLAGAWSIYREENIPITMAEAEDWIRSMDWNKRDNSQEADELRCRNTILQSTVRIGYEDFSIGEAVVAVVKCRDLSQTASVVDATRVLARNGIRIYCIGSKLPGNEISTKNLMAVATNNKLLREILSNTPWSDGAHSNSLSRIEGAIIPKAPIHFSGVGLSRSVLLPIESDELGTV